MWLGLSLEEHRLWSTQASVVVMWAQQLGLEGSVAPPYVDLSSPTRDATLPPALEGGFLTTRPPGKSLLSGL